MQNSTNNQIAKANQQPITVRTLLSNVNYKKHFEELLGKKANGFMSSIINLVNSDKNLAQCDPHSVVASAVIAAALDLPIDRNLGFAWIVPYHDKNKGLKAQFQLGYRGYVQLALRTGQYEKINVTEIFEGQLKKFNPLTEDLEIDFEAKQSNKVIGYAAYFRLVNGFEKTVYWPIEKVLEHAKRFSKTFKNGPWQTDFNEMAKKTVLKNTLAKWGILSIEMQEAIKSDQAVVQHDKNGTHYEYVDNPYYDDEAIEYTIEAEPETEQTEEETEEEDMEQEIPEVEPITKDQVTAIQTLLTKIGLKTEEEKHAYVSEILKKEMIKSIKDLNKAEASEVISKLNEIVNKHPEA